MSNEISYKTIPQDELYSHIYSYSTHRGVYGGNSRRDLHFIKYISENIKIGSSILDAGCGRGFLIRWANNFGYIAKGTEIADSLFNPGGDLYGMPVQKLFYQELNIINSNSYDVVISNDVLEHLDNEQLVEESIGHLIRISRHYILISTGGLRAAHNPLPDGPRNLHNIVRNSDWWLQLCKKHFHIDKTFIAGGSLFIFGHKFKKIGFPEYPLRAKVGCLRQNISYDTLEQYPEIIINDGRQRDPEIWSLAWGHKKDHDAVIETGFFWNAMHIDRHGLYQESSLNRSWDIIKKFKAPKSAAEIILSHKHTSKYSQTNDPKIWEGVVLALQNPADRSVLSCGTTEDYYYFVEEACYAYGSDLFLKMHPWNNNEVATRLKEIAKKHGCEIAKTDHSVIEKCQFVLIYNSTFAVDCFLRNIKVAQYAPGYWHQTPAVDYTDRRYPSYEVMAQNENLIECGHKLADFLIWKYCFHMNMATDKWIKMLKLYANSNELFPLNNEFCYAMNNMEP